MSARLTTKEWIARARAIHGDRYDYSKVEYVRAADKVVIICGVHGTFAQEASQHIHARTGCPVCANRVRLTTAEWITRARSVHGETYDYSMVEYVSLRVQVCIRCSVHGTFMQIAANHLAGQGCAKCAGKYRYTETEWLAELERVWGGTLDFSKTIYRSRISNARVTVTCRTHGDFTQTGYALLHGIRSCPRCGGNGRYSNDQWVERAREVHGDRYDYSKVAYVDGSQAVTLVCSTHGLFSVLPVKHIHRKQGCPECSSWRMYTRETWIDAARAVHGNTYDYNQVVYTNLGVKVVLVCGTHGCFEVTPHDHLTQRSGCPRCRASRGERIIARILDALGVAYESERRFESCSYTRALPFDFYLPMYGALVEFDGLQHFKPVFWNNGVTAAEAEAALRGVQLRDQIKNEWAKTEGYPLLRTSYLDGLENEIANFIAGLDMAPCRATSKTRGPKT